METGEATRAAGRSARRGLKSSQLEGMVACARWGSNGGDEKRSDLGKYSKGKLM